MAYFLVCAECTLLTKGFERGWRAYLTGDEFEPAEVMVLCPTCSEREFGASHGADADDDEAA